MIGMEDLMQNHKNRGIKLIINKRLKLLDLEEQANETASRPVELDQQSIGRLSRMDALQQQAMAKALDIRRQNEKQALKEALNRIAQDGYGVCIDCNESIEFERLKLKPSVLKCLDCMQI